MSASDREKAIQLGIAERVVFFRHLRGLTQTALAAACDCTFQQIQKYEWGVNRIPSARLKVMADFLRVPIHEFYGVPSLPFKASRSRKNQSAFHALSVLQAKAPERHRAICRLIETMAGTCG